MVNMPDEMNMEVIDTGRKTLTAKYYYLDVELDFGDNNKAQPFFTKELVKLCVVNAVKKLFGEFGSATMIDVLLIDESTRKIILRCPADFYVKLRSSLTLATHYEGHNCYFRVHKACSTLLSLACNSHTYDFSICMTNKQ